MLNAYRDRPEERAASGDIVHQAASIKMKTKASARSRSEIEAVAGDIFCRPGFEWSREYLMYHADRLALDFEWLLEAHQQSSAIETLEIGGYPFFLTLALHRKGTRLTVVDKLTPVAERLSAEAGLKVVGCDIEVETLPFHENSFDHVLFNEIFEHLRINPIATLREVLRVLRPGGRLWLSTPNLKSLRGIVNFLFKSEAWAVVGGGVYEQYKHLERHGWMGHVREYTPVEVAKFLMASGFEIEDIIYRGGSNNPAVNVIEALAPSLKPYFTILASKPRLA